MRMATSERGSPGTRAPARDLQEHLMGVVRRVSGAARIARRNATSLLARVPGTMHATRAGARGTTTALQTLPDPLLRWLAAGSVGLGAGFQLAGAPRLVVAAGVAPALIMGAAIVLRPIRPIVPGGGDLVTIVGLRGLPAEYRTEMADEQSRLDDDGGPSAHS
jgi:hypothetical protein